MNLSPLRINPNRLLHRIELLAEIGAIDGGGVCRLALSDEDREARDLVLGWMRDLGLDVSVDQIGNVVGLREGLEPGPPVMTGSHIDTVATGGRYDGNLGVLAGLEVVETLNEAQLITRKPIAVGFFTNEEGVRYTPDMMGSAVHQGMLGVQDMLNVAGTDGSILGEELERIGYAGYTPSGSFRADSFVELHVEQGPVLEALGLEIGAVEKVQGISWTEYQLRGTANHAGTTPMAMRNDAGYVAAAISVEARRLTTEMGGDQVATVGVTELKPNLINVIPKNALVTVDLRNTDNDALTQAEHTMAAFVAKICKDEGVQFESRSLVRLEPVSFASEMVSLISSTAQNLGLSVHQMPSGAGHDAQMFAPNCPTAMIFVPSRGGISHNVAEFTEGHHLQAGADVLLQVMLARAQ